MTHVNTVCTYTLIQHGTRLAHAMGFATLRDARSRSPSRCGRLASSPRPSSMEDRPVVVVVVVVADRPSVVVVVAADRPSVVVVVADRPSVVVEPCAGDDVESRRAS